MTAPIHHPHEPNSNADRDAVTRFEPKCLRTYTPSQAVLARSAGVFHWTSDGRKLFDFSSGVLVANLGHNPRRWMQHFTGYLGWSESPWAQANGQTGEYFAAAPMTAYNGITPIET